MEPEMAPLIAQKETYYLRKLYYITYIFGILYFCSTAGTLGGISMNAFTVLCGFIMDRYGIFWSRSLSTIMIRVCHFLVFF